MEPNGILIYGELSDDFSIAPVVCELLTKASELKKEIWNQRVMVCLIGKRMNYDCLIDKLGRFGADEVVVVNDDRLSEYNKEYHCEIFTEIAKKYPPRIILIGATEKGKDIASYTATKLKTGLTADCTDLGIGEYNLLLSTRPTFGGKLTADILCDTFPQMATVKPNTFKTAEKESNVSAKFNWFDLDKIDRKIEVIQTVKKAASLNDVSAAEIVVAGGAGACKDNGFTLVYQLAQKLKAAVGGTREAFEKGYITKSQQIGQTGKTISPKLYIAVGISGANQHMAGIQNSGKIIAINKDKDAPIFQNADVGIVGDLFEIIPELLENLDKKEEKNE